MKQTSTINEKGERRAIPSKAKTYTGVPACGKSAEVSHRGLGNKRVIVELTEKVKEKILYLCGISPDKEWSGIIFYEPRGMITGPDDLLLVVKDFYLQDFGSSGETEFTQDETLANYMALHEELFDCRMGLMHSHNRMKVFFSGVDITVLYSHARSFGILLSIVVNNAGHVIAKIAINDRGEQVTRVSSKYLDFNGREILAKPVTETKGCAIPLIHDCETTNIAVPEHRDTEFMTNIKNVQAKKAVYTYPKGYGRELPMKENQEEEYDLYAKYGTL